MGLLDDAIREHLDLKRQHGAAEDELARQEAEALGPVTEADIADRQDDAVDEPAISSGERQAGWPFDRVAENELADEPEEPSFEWGERDSGEVEVPSFVPAEPLSDPVPDAEPGFVDAPTAAFDVFGEPVGEEEVDELAAPEPPVLEEEDPLAEDLEAGPPSVRPETEFMPPPGLKLDELEPLGPEPPSHELPALITPPTDPDAELSESEPLEPLEPDDPVEVEGLRGEALPVETEPPLSEPEPLEPYPLESIEAGPDPLAPDSSPEPESLAPVSAPEPEPSADPGEAPPELDPGFDLPPEEEPLPAQPGVFAPEPPLLEESAEPPLEEGPPPVGPEPSVRLDPTAEQGDPPGTAADPLDAEADPPTQAWSIEDEAEGDLGPAEAAPIDERPVFEPLPDAEEGADRAFDPPPEDRLDLDEPVDADLDLAPVSEEEPPQREQPPAARGFFEETEEHETLWHEERPGADPDFEN